jgi:hypothetical protein
MTSGNWRTNPAGWGIGGSPEGLMPWFNVSGGGLSVASGVLSISSGTAGNQVGNAAMTDQAYAPLTTMQLEFASVWKTGSAIPANNRMECGLADWDCSAGASHNRIGFFLDATGLYANVTINDVAVYQQIITSPISAANVASFYRYAVRVSKTRAQFLIRTSPWGDWHEVGLYETLGTAATLWPAQLAGLRGAMRNYNPGGGILGATSMQVASADVSMVGMYSGRMGRRIIVNLLTDTLLCSGPGILETVDVVSLGTPQQWQLEDWLNPATLGGCGNPILLRYQGLVAARTLHLNAYFGEGLYFNHLGGASAAVLNLTIRG